MSHQQQQQNQQVQIPEQNQELGEYDVVCGRGGYSTHHVGNKNYLKFIAQNADEYSKITAKTKKTDFSKKIVEIVRTQWGGRFLSRIDDNSRLWYDVGDQQARRKTSQALRDAVDAARKEKEAQSSATTATTSSATITATVATANNGPITPTTSNGSDINYEQQQQNLSTILPSPELVSSNHQHHHHAGITPNTSAISSSPTLMQSQMQIQYQEMVVSECSKAVLQNFHSHAVRFCELDPSSGLQREIDPKVVEYLVERALRETLAKYSYHNQSQAQAPQAIATAQTSTISTPTPTTSSQQQTPKVRNDNSSQSQPIMPLPLNHPEPPTLYSAEQDDNTPYDTFATDAATVDMSLSESFAGMLSLATNNEGTAKMYNAGPEQQGTTMPMDASSIETFVESTTGGSMSIGGLTSGIWGAGSGNKKATAVEVGGNQNQQQQQQDSSSLPSWEVERIHRNNLEDNNIDTSTVWGGQTAVSELTIDISSLGTIGSSSYISNVDHLGTWYFYVDENKDWKPYDNEIQTKMEGFLLEYLSAKKTKFEVYSNASRFWYDIDIKKMKQTNRSTRVTREICRTTNEQTPKEYFNDKKRNKISSINSSSSTGGVGAFSSLLHRSSPKQSHTNNTGSNFISPIIKE